MELIISLLPIIILFAVMYFMIIRPQQQQVKKTQAMLDSLRPGDTVVTIGGLHGVIDEIDETNSVVVLDCEGVYLTFDRRAVGRVVEESKVSKSTTVDTEATTTIEEE